MDKLLIKRRANPLEFFNSAKRIIEQMTEVSNDHMTPELSLRLVTPNCPLWTRNYKECPLPDPFWAFYWPGGQALTRYLLDNKNIIRGKNVLDVGSGCGSVAIAAAKLNLAKSVTANDIDPVRYKKMEPYLKMRKEDPEGFFNSTKKKIEENTEITNENSMTPEISLRLSTPNCEMFEATPDQSPFFDPFWAYYWQGGQALTRYLLDNGDIIKGKTVIDIGSGCGSLAIAAAKLGGAISITANDIDPVAEVAIQLNAEINGIKPKSIKLLTDNIVERTVAAYKWDCIFLGDMLYDEKLNTKLMDWLLRSQKPGVEIFIGSPIRHKDVFVDYKENLRKLKSFTMSDEDKELNMVDDNTVGVWKLKFRKK